MKQDENEQNNRKDPTPVADNKPNGKSQLKSKKFLTRAMCSSNTVTHNTHMLPFLVQIEDGLPVSDQIIQAVRKAMLTGQLAAGDEFPSVRTLSLELRISPTTAHKVVAVLKDAGYLASRPGIGMVVTTPDLPAHEEKLEQLQPLCAELLKEAGDLHLKFEDVVAALRRAADENKFHEPGGRTSSANKKSKP